MFRRTGTTDWLCQRTASQPQLETLNLLSFLLIDSSKGTKGSVKPGALVGEEMSCKIRHPNKAPSSSSERKKYPVPKDSHRCGMRHPTKIFTSKQGVYSQKNPMAFVPLGCQQWNPWRGKAGAGKKKQVHPKQVLAPGYPNCAVRATCTSARGSNIITCCVHPKMAQLQCYPPGN